MEKGIKKKKQTNQRLLTRNENKALNSTRFLSDDFQFFISPYNLV